jgi:uncharacterized protein YuzE
MAGLVPAIHANTVSSGKRLKALNNLKSHCEWHGEVAPGLNVDLDAAGDVVGFDIDGASRRLDLTTLETIALPTTTTKAA